MRSQLAFITAADLTPATSALSGSVREEHRIVDLVAWADNNASNFPLDVVVKEQACAIMEFFGSEERMQTHRLG